MSHECNEFGFVGGSRECDFARCGLRYCAAR